MNVLVPLRLSMQVAAIATVLVFFCGIAIARFLARKSLGIVPVLETVILLPMVFPPTITGYLLLLLLGKYGPIGSLLDTLGISVVFTWVAAVIASFIVALPLMYQSSKAAFASVDHRVENAARTLGQSEGRIFWRITLPLSSRSIIAGTALAFARAFGEFGATLMIAGNIPGRTATLPLALFDAVESGRTHDAMLLLGITVGLCFVLVALVTFAGNSIKSGFRQGKNNRSAKTHTPLQ